MDIRLNYREALLQRRKKLIKDVNVSTKTIVVWLDPYFIWLFDIEAKICKRKKYTTIFISTISAVIKSKYLKAYLENVIIHILKNGSF